MEEEKIVVGGTKRFYFPEDFDHEDVDQVLEEMGLKSETFVEYPVFKTKKEALEDMKQAAEDCPAEAISIEE